MTPVPPIRGRDAVLVLVLAGVVIGALFGAGVLVGAGLALLFAPTSGRELREEIGERAAELKDRAASVVESTAGEAQDRVA